MEEFLGRLADDIWNPMAYFVLGLGVLYTFVIKGSQWRRIPDMIRQLRESEGGEGGLSSFQALVLALSSRVGVGSIAGVAVAVSGGGPGALLWMAITGLVSCSVGYAEAALAQVYKHHDDDGEDRGGMVYYIKRGLGKPVIAMIVAIIGVIGYGFIFSGIQVNTIASSMQLAWGVPTWVVGLVAAVLIGFVIVGGTKRIVHAAQFLVPVLAIGYLISALGIIVWNLDKVPAAINLIVSSAFGANQILAGITGAAVSWGVRRAVFASANGNGEATYAAAAARVSHPAKQGLVQSFSIYVDVLLICMATGLLIVVSGTYNVADPAGGFIINNLPGVAAGPNFVQAAIDAVLPGWGPSFVAVAVFMFGLTCMIFYYFVANVNLRFMLDGRQSRTWDTALKVGAVAIAFFGAVVNSKSMWAIGDIGFGAIGWINMACLVFMFPTVYKVCKDYDRQRKLGIDPIFDPKALGIKNADYWESEHFFSTLPETPASRVAQESK